MNFDSALPRLVALVCEIFGQDVAASGLFLRDAAGAVTFIIRSNVDATLVDAFNAKAAEALGGYNGAGAITPEELYDDALSTNEGAFSEKVQLEDGAIIYVKLLDRQIIGQDWQKPNFTETAPIPVVTFFSCKGGVGRSTALSVAASYFSGQGKNVTIIDFDLEAPGIGSLLLKAEDLPDYGLLDLLIERRQGGDLSRLLERCIAPSPLTGGRGLVEVLPALGSIGRANPSTVMPKLGRAFLSSFIGDEEIPLVDQVRAIITEIAKLGRSDVIFVDARAGLSESSAPAVIGLGGEVLLFGVNTPQTFECYRYLFAHLSRFVPDVASETDWRHRLRMVHAKSSGGSDGWDKFREESYSLFSESLYEEAEGVSLEIFNFDIDDPVAPHYAWPIPFDADFAEFDPRSRSRDLNREFYDRTFGPFVQNLWNTLYVDEPSHGR